MTENPQITAEELRVRFAEGQKPGRDFVVVDLRGNDFTGGTVRGSLNIPIQSLAYAVPTLFSLTLSANVSDVIFFCGGTFSFLFLRPGYLVGWILICAGSSCGRGPKGATLFSDYARQQGVSSPRGVVLTGGIKGWVASGEEYVDLMDGYESQTWGRST